MPVPVAFSGGSRGIHSWGSLAFLGGIDLFRGQQLENPLPAVHAVGLFGVLDQDRLFTRRAGSQQLVPQKGQNLAS